MRNYRIKIELLSDVCVSDGGIYNSAIDTDICYDEYGFPYIPAKRLKGCLRECALELKDWGMPIGVQEMFGTQGNDDSDSEKAGKAGAIHIRVPISQTESVLYRKSGRINLSVQCCVIRRIF